MRMQKEKQGVAYFSSVSSSTDPWYWLPAVATQGGWRLGKISLMLVPSLYQDRGDLMEETLPLQSGIERRTSVAFVN